MTSEGANVSGSMPPRDLIPPPPRTLNQSFFAPRMLSIVQLALEKGSLDKTWSLALLNPIPKALGIVKADELRPLVLQKHVPQVVCSLHCVSA